MAKSKMKTSVLILVLLISNCLSAQNYQNICSPGVTMFRDSTGNLKGFRYDTLQLPGNGDSVFLTFFTVHIVPGQSWVDTTGGTLLGRKITRRHDGWFLFLNQAGDTIRINPMAGQNETWRWMELPDKKYIRAEISRISLDSVMGLADSVKTILLQAFDSLDNPMEHPANNLLFKISKHFGLIQTYDLWLFPGISVKYILAGKTNPKIGVQPLRMRDVYDFNAGDEFHYSEYEKTLDYHGSTFNIRYIWHILTKTMAADSSSVTYSVWQCLHETYNVFPDLNEHETNSQDTLSITYNFSDLEAQYWFNRLPDEFICVRKNAGWSNANHYEEAVVSYPGTDWVMRKTRHDAYLSEPGTNYLWEPWDIAQPEHPNEHWTSFVSGLGKTSSTEYAWLGFTHNQYLVYYKKGSETWGTPVAKDCSALTGDQDTSKSDIQPIQIMPNPVLTEARIYFSDFSQSGNSRLVLYDCLGKEVFNIIIHSNPFIFDRNGISNGIYILNYIDNNGNRKGKLKIIIQN